MKIVMFEIKDSSAPALAMLRGAHELHCVPDVLNAQSAGAYPDAEVISTFVSSPLDAVVLRRFPRLRLLALRAAGFDGVDLGYCRAHGITVCNAPGYGDASVAEHGFALLLALGKHIVDSVAQTRRGNFGYRPRQGFELLGKTLGVIGTGRIGKHAITIGRGFGMNVIAHDAYPKPEEAERLGFRYASLAEVLAAADVLTLHVPATPETTGMISDKEFALMKPGAVLINTARGAVVDVAALIRALASGKLGGAGLDVLPHEPLIQTEERIFDDSAPETPALREMIADHALLKYDNVIVTPHNAYNTKEALERITEISVENIKSFVDGHPVNTVT